MNYYLKATDEQALWEALETADLAVRDYDLEDPLNVAPEEPDESWVQSGAYTWRFTGQALDMIGTIYTPTGNTLTDSDGNDYPEMQAVSGFHANMKAPSGLTGLPTVDEPATPYRKWAGE